MDWYKLEEHTGELPSCSSVLAPRVSILGQWRQDSACTDRDLGI